MLKRTIMPKYAVNDYVVVEDNEHGVVTGSIYEITIDSHNIKYSIGIIDHLDTYACIYEIAEENLFPDIETYIKYQAEKIRMNALSLIDYELDEVFVEHYLDTKEVG